MRTTALIITLLLAANLASAQRTILLVDDHDVLYRAGTRRVLHPAVRVSSEPLLGEVKPWEMAIGWCSVYRDPSSGKYQLWYQAYSGKTVEDKKLQCVVAYAESDDGLRFTRPELTLFPYKDHKTTNIVLIGAGGYGDRYCNCVVVDPREKDPGKKYKMAYYDWGVVNGREEPGLFVAFSPDGIHWTKNAEGPLNRTAYGGRGMQPPIVGENVYTETKGKDGRVRKTWAYPAGMSDAADVMWDEPRGVWAIYGKSWMHGPDGSLGWKHGMARCQSTDFIHWSRPQFIIGPDEFDPPELEFHTSPVFYHAGRYFSLNQRLDRKGGGQIEIELMTSVDGLAWERNFRDTRFIAPSPAGSFDHRTIVTNSTYVVHGDELRFYYGGYSGGAIGGGSTIESKDQTSGVGMARIPLDRFAGIEPVEVSSQPTLKKPLKFIGQVTLKPVDLTGVRSITVNATSASGGGGVRVELLDEDGFRVPGFTADESAVLTGDALNHRATWKDGDLSKLTPGKYHLRLHLDHATVYAVTLK